jgi:hypothetical protein
MDYDRRAVDLLKAREPRRPDVHRLGHLGPGLSILCDGAARWCRTELPHPRRKEMTGPPTQRAAHQGGAGRKLHPFETIASLG